MIEPFARDCVHCKGSGAIFLYDGWHCDDCNTSCRAKGPFPAKQCHKGWTRQARRALKKRKQVVNASMNRDYPVRKTSDCDKCGQTSDSCRYVLRPRAYWCASCRKADPKNGVVL